MEDRYSKGAVSQLNRKRNGEMAQELAKELKSAMMVILSCGCHVHGHCKKENISRA